VDLPYQLEAEKLRYRTDVRMTRVCQDDTSQLGDGKSLESRMELVLSCDGLGYFSRFCWANNNL